MSDLKKQVLELLYKENVQCASGIESLAESIQQIFIHILTADWYMDDCK